MPKTPYLKSQTRQTDWCVVIPKLPESLIDGVAEKLIQHFSLTPQEAQETIQHTPIILLDDLEHETASKVKAIFDGSGVELVLTQEPSFKKKCFRVLWPKESAEILSRWRSDASAQSEDTSANDPALVTESSTSDGLASGRRMNNDDEASLRKRISELEARLKIAEARDKELKGELDKREKNSHSRDEILQQEKKVSQKLQGLFDQGQKESTDWMRKAERAQDRIKVLEAEKNDLSEKLQARVREVGNWKVKTDQLDAEREDLTKQLEDKNRESDQRQRAFEQQLVDLDKRNVRDKTGYVDEKKQWSTMHEQFQQEIRAAQQKSTELTDQIKALRRNIADREEASKISEQAFKEVSRKNQVLQQKMTQMEGQAIKFEKNREDLTRQLSQVSAELGEKNKLYESAVSVHEKRITSLTSESQAEREHFTDEKKSLERELENLRGEITALVSQKGAVQECLSETEKRCSELTESLEVHVKDQQSSQALVEQLKQTESQLNSEIQNLQNQLALTAQEKTAQAVSLQQLAARVFEFEQLCERQGGSLQSESAKLAQERETVERSAGRIHQLENEQRNLEKLLETSNVDYRDAVGRIAELEKNLSALTENQKGLEQSLSQKMQELDRWRESAAQSESESSSRQERIEELEILKKHAEDERDKLAGVKAMLEQQRDDLFAQVTLLTETRERLNTQKTELQNQIDDLSSSVKTLRLNLDKRTQDLESSLHEREKQGAEWSVKYNELKEMADTERESLRAEQSRLENVLQAVREEKTAALKDVSDLESRTAELDQKREGLARELAEKTEQLGQWTFFAEQAEEKAESRHKVIAGLEILNTGLQSERDSLAKAKEQLESEKQSLENHLIVTTQERDQLILLRQKLESQIVDFQETGSRLAEDLQKSIREREIQDEDWSLKFQHLKKSAGDERQDLLGERQQLNHTIEGLTDDKDFAQKTIRELETRISELHDTRNSLERDLRGRTEELLRVTQAAEESRALSQDQYKKIERLEYQMAEVEEERDALGAKLAEVRNSYEEALLQKQNLEAAVERWSAEAKDVSAKLQVETAAYEAFRIQQAEQNKQWNQKYNALAEKSAEASEVFEEERVRYEKTLAEITKDKAEAHKEIGRLEERIGSLDRSRQGLQDQLAAKSADYENYFSAKTVELQRWMLLAEQTGAESEARQKRVGELETTQSQLEHERQGLTEALSAMTEAQELARNEMLALKAAHLELQEKSNGVHAELAQKKEALQKSIQDSETQKADWSIRLGDLKSSTDGERTTLLNEKTRLENLLAELEREKTQALTRLETQEKSIQMLESQRNAFEQDLNAKLEELQQWTGLAEQAEIESETRQKKIEALESAKAGLEEERSNLLSVQEQLKSQVVLFNKNISEAGLERERLLEIKQSLEKSLGALEFKHKALQDEFKQSTEKLKAQGLSLEQQTVEWNGKYEKLKKDTDAERKILLADQQRLTNAMNSLQADKTDALKEIGRLEGRIESLDETREQLERALRVKTEELAQWTQTAEQSGAMAEERQGKIDQLENVRRDLESEREILVSTKTSLAEHRNQLLGANAILESEREELLAVKAQLEHEREQLNQKVVKLTATGQDLAEWKANLEFEVEKLEDQRRSLIAELEKRNKELEKAFLEGRDQDAQWSEKYAELKAATDSEHERLSKTLDGLAGEKNIALNQIQQLDSRLTALNTDRAGLEKELKQKTAELAQWIQLAEQSEATAEERQKKIDGLEKAKAELESQRDDLFLSKAQLEDQRDKLLFIKSELESERAAFADQLIEMTSARDALAEVKQKQESKVEVLESQGRSLSVELEKIRRMTAEQDLSWNKKHTSLSESSTKERAVLLEEQTRLETTVQQLRVDKAEALHEIDVLESRIQELDSKHGTLAQELTLKTEELSQWAQLAEQSEAKAQERQGQIDQLETVRRDLEGERDQLGLKFAELTANRNELEEWKLKLEAEIEKLKDHSRSLALELEQRTKELEMALLDGTNQEAQWTMKYAELQSLHDAKQDRLTYSLERLKDDKETALTVIQQLEGRISDLTSTRDGVTKELKVKSEELLQWIQLANQSKSMAEESQEKIELLQRERDQLSNEKSAVTDDRDRLLAAKNDLESERDELLAAKNQLESERIRLVDKLADVSEIRDGLEYQKKKIESELKKLEAIVQKLTADLNSRTAEFAEAQLKNKKDSEVWSAQVSQIQSESEAEQKTLLVEQERLKTTLHYVTEEQLRSLKTIAGLESRIESYEKQCKQFTFDLDKKTEEIFRWAQLVEQVEEKAESWRKQADELEKVKKSLEVQCEALRAAKTQLDSERQVMAQSLVDITEEKDSAVSQIKSLHGDLKEMTSQQSMLQETLSTKEKELEQSLQSRKDSEAKWSEKFSELSTESSVESQALNAEIDKLKSLLKNIKNEKTNALKEIETLEKNHEELELNRSEIEKELGLRTAELKKLSDWAVQTETKVRDQQRKMEALEAAKTDVSLELEELLETKKGFEADLRDSSAELNRLKQHLERAEAAAETEMQRAEGLEQAKNEAETRCEKLTAEIEQMVREKKTLVQQVVEIQSGLDSLEKENNLTSLEARRKFLEEELAARAKDVEKWMESTRLAEEELQRIKGEQQPSTEKHQNLEKKCLDLEAELKKLLGAQKQSGQKDKDIARLEAELQTVSAARDSAVQEAKLLLEKNEKKAAVLSQDWEERYTVLKAAITREREGFERERADLRKQQDKLKKLEDQLGQSQEKIAALETGRNELQEKLKVMQTAAVNNPAAASNGEQKKIYDELDRAREEIRKLTLKYHTLEDIKNEFVALLGSERQRYDVLQGQYDQLKDRFGELVRKQTESISFDQTPAVGKARGMNTGTGGGALNSEVEKMQRLKQILDFEDKRGGLKE